MASPASTSPPTVLRTIRTPLTLSFCSISISCGIICSYFVAFVCGGKTECPSICPITDNTTISLLGFATAVFPNSFISFILSTASEVFSLLLSFPSSSFFKPLFKISFSIKTSSYVLCFFYSAHMV